MSSRIDTGRKPYQKGTRKPRIATVAPGQRTPRMRDSSHMGCIAALPCVICGARPVEVAHIRYPDASHAKPITGVGTKPADRWTLPLCPGHHRLSNSCQHNFDERSWWEEHGINPLSLSSALFAMTGNIEAMEQIIARRDIFGAKG